MKIDIVKTIRTGIGVVSLCIWFTFFIIFVKPEIGRIIIPRVIDFSEAYAQSNRGIDLDPILVSSLDGNDDSSSSLYSTRFGSSGGGIYGDLVTSDTRVIALNRFLVDYHSPMAPYAELFVASADEVGLDWRLTPAIAGVESGFGRITPYNSANAWGWRGGPGGDFSRFETWDESIPYIITRIAIGYGTNMDIFVMEPIYCPPCGRTPGHPWANGVIGYMTELSEYRRNL